MRVAIISIFFLAILPTGQASEACDCSKDSGTSIDFSTADGSELYIKFPSQSVTQANRTAYVCGDAAASTQGVTLWMPGHGHGSAPTEVEAFEESGCAKVNNVRFVMKGKWQLLTVLEDYSLAIASVVVR